jgi:hypothetical protein
MINLKQQLEAFETGIILDSSGETDECCNFYDWFCTKKTLKKKSIQLFKQVKKFITANPQINLETHYVFFKNNCPLSGNLYDDFRICDCVTRNVIYTVTPKSGHKNQEFPATIWGIENGFKSPLKQGKTFTDLLK